MNGRRIAVATMLMFLAVSMFAANPFLDAKDDNPICAKFRGTEWGDEIGRDEIPLDCTTCHNACCEDVVVGDFQTRIRGSKVAC